MALDFKKFFEILTAIAPVILMAIPGGAALAPLVPLIVKGIADAQQTAKTGPEKKALVMQLVNDVSTGTNIVKPNTIDTALITQAAGFGIDAVITAVNAVASAHAAMPNVPPAPSSVAPTAAKK